VLQGTTSEMK